MHTSHQRPRTGPQRRGRLIVEELESRVVPSALPRPDHVVLVIEENHAYSEIIGSANAPYINSLAQQGALMTASYAIEHPSQPNYLDLFSGDNQKVSGDTTPTNLPFTTPNLGAELLTAGDSFVGYSETLPSVGYQGDSYTTDPKLNEYMRKHNPWANFTYDPPGVNQMPSSVNQPFTSFPTDFTKLPTLSIVVPNEQNDMHDGTVQQGDTWLKNNLDSYAQWAKTHNSLLVVTWDEDDQTVVNQIPTFFVGQMVQPGSSGQTINHFGVLRTLEDLYGLSYAGASASATPITSIWQGQLQFAGAPFSGHEKGGAITITVTRTGDTTAGATVPYATSDGTARAGTDYTAASGTLTFAPGQASQTFTVTPLDNGLVTVDGLTVNLTLGQPGGSGNAPTAVLTILDDDLPVVADGPTSAHQLDVARAFAHSREHYTQFVVNAYQQYLKRRPDTAGLNAWVSGMLAGTYSDEQVEAQFLGSVEYISTHGGTGQAWVTGMYQDLLGRTPGASEVQGWVNVLNSGTPASAVALGFAASQERETQRVLANYLTYLGRGPRPDEVALWVNGFLGGLSNEDMVAGFVGSPEYYLNAQKGRSNQARWVARAYLDVLFRPASVGEVNNWLKSLM
jgi:hypothetical protein